MSPGAWGSMVLHVISSSLSAVVEGQPNERKRLMTDVIRNGLQGIALPGLVVNTLESAIEGLFRASSHHFKTWAALSEAEADAQMAPYLAKWDSWKSHVPGAGPPAATPTTALTPAETAGEKKKMSFVVFLAGELTSGDAVRVARATALKAKWVAFQAAHPQESGGSRLPVLAKHGLDPFGRGGPRTPARSSWRCSRSSRRFPHHPAHGGVGGEVVAAQRPPTRSCPRPPPGNRDFGMKIKRPEIPSPKDVARAAKYAKERKPLVSGTRRQKKLGSGRDCQRWFDRQRGSRACGN